MTESISAAQRRKLFRCVLIVALVMMAWTAAMIFAADKIISIRDGKERLRRAKEAGKK